MRKTRRAWLNKAGYHSIGMVILNIDTQYDEVSLTIGDCTRTVCIDFGPYGDLNKGELKNARNKIKTLREYLDMAEEAVDEMERKFNEA